MCRCEVIVNAVRPADANEIAAVAEIHATRIHDGFLVQLGRPFLRRLYRRARNSSKAFVLVFIEDENVRGFVAAALDTGAFYRDFVFHDGVVAGLLASPRILRGLRSVVETLRYGMRKDETLPKAEILAVAVRDDALGRGVGTQLLESALGELSRRGIDAVRVVTAVANEPALRTYERVGFERRGITYVHSDVAQVVLVWR
jgi:ribosomal protein S18 acetylase RimI-like enzyme